jgi:(S)-sulfolactate dehydrogenase
MDEAAVDRLRQAAAVTYDPDLVNRPDALRELAGEADALIVRNQTQVRGPLLAALTQAKAVGRLGVGLDNIDVEGCKAKGIEVIPATGANAVSVAEYVIAVALILTRRAFAASAAVVAGAWPRAELSQGGEIFGKTLGLIGFGGIAREVASRARAMGMAVVAHDPMIPADDPIWADYDAQPGGLTDVLGQADVLSLHVPLTGETRNLIDAQALKEMKDGAILINTARGGVVDEAALATALHEGQIAGAALDVFAEEPLAAGGPLADAPNLIATPHIGGVTRQANVRVSGVVADRVLAALGAA